MSIEINGHIPRPPQEAGEGKQVAQNRSQIQDNGGTTSPRPGGSAGDKVSLTDQASQLQSLQQELSALPVVDAQRVQEVQRSLATGSLQIDPVSVADKMLKLEAGLGGGR